MTQIEHAHVVCLIKNGMYIPAFLIAVGFPEQMSWSITALTALMIIDFVTGILASAHIDGLRAITSKRMIAGALSKIVVLLVPFVLVIAGRGIGIDLEQYIQGTIVILILAEAYSNLGNIQSFRTRKRVSEIDAVSAVLKGIRNYILSLLEKAK